jgi:hypothetical protein
MEPLLDKNLANKLWQKLGYNALLLSDFMKLSKIAITAVLGSCEDEWTSSNLAFVNNKVQNRLGGHLAATLKLYSQGYYTLRASPLLRHMLIGVSLERGLVAICNGNLFLQFLQV